MALDLRLYKAFDNLFDLIFKDLKVTINDYPKVFEENFERTKSGLKLTPFFSSCSEEEFSELKYDLFNKYCNKFIYQSSEVIAIEAPEHVEWLKNKSSEINWNQWNVYSDYLESEKKYNKETIEEIGKLADKPIFDSCTNVQFSKSLIDKTWRVFPFLIVNNHFWRRFNFFQNIF